MKRIARLFAVFFVFSIILTGCELFKDCETCSLVVEENGVEISRSPGVLYCGDELEEKKDADSWVGDKHSFYDCS